MAHRPTDELRERVRTWSGVGMPVKLIAGQLDIAIQTLYNHYARELSEGQFEANARVAGKLYQQCMEGNTSAIIFWLKTQLGWRDVSRVEHTGADGGPIELKAVDAPPKETYEQFIERKQRESQLRLVATAGATK